jgi:hypothetical protein
MIEGTVGQLIIDKALPKEFRTREKLDKNGIKNVLNRVVKERPDLAKEVSMNLLTAGKEIAYRTGGLPFWLEHLQTSSDSLVDREELRASIDRMWRREDISPEQRDQMLVDMVSSKIDKVIDKTYDNELKRGNPLAIQVASGSRGNRASLANVLTGSGLYTNFSGKLLPYPVLRSYSEGLTGAEYFTAAGGARAGLAETKLSVATSGFLAKMLNQVNHDLIVTARDEDSDPDREHLLENVNPQYKKSVEYLRNWRGYPVDTSDEANEGKFLAGNFGNYGRNTLLTRKVLNELKDAGVKKILIRSPIVGGPMSGGLYSKDVGILEKNNLEPLYTQVGLSAAQAISERITQTTLGAKHQGGVVGKSSMSAFDKFTQFLQVPGTYRDEAAHSDLDGIVSKIEDAPQGGSYIHVNNVSHYAPPGQEIKVKVGDEVEAGDTMTDGVPNPQKVISNKGIGAGRKYLIDLLRPYGHRKNLEVLVRGVADHVVLTDDMPDVDPTYVQGKVVPYQELEHFYSMPKDTKLLPINQSRGKYLMSPILHYTIGTKIKKSVLKDLEEFGVPGVFVSKNRPPFEPVMIRIQDKLQHHPDALASQIGTSLQKSFLTRVHKGTASSDTNSTSYVPTLVIDPLNFGIKPKIKSWDVNELSAPLPHPTIPVQKAPSDFKLQEADLLDEAQEENSPQERMPVDKLIGSDDDLGFTEMFDNSMDKDID